MADVHIVRARSHFGTKSLDLTLPSALIRKYGIKRGEAFEVTVDDSGRDLIIHYKRIYSIK